MFNKKMEKIGGDKCGILLFGFNSICINYTRRDMKIKLINTLHTLLMIQFILCHILIFSLYVHSVHNLGAYFKSLAKRRTIDTLTKQLPRDYLRILRIFIGIQEYSPVYYIKK